MGEKSEKNMKIVVVGDESSGKTKMLTTFCCSGDNEYSHGKFDSYNVPFTVKDTFLYLSIWDTDDSSKYDSMRPISYTGTHVFIICFSIFDERSFKNVKSKWLPEINKNCPGSPIILVGTDNIHDKPENIKSKINSEQANKLALEIGAEKYVQYSFQNSPESVFTEAVSAAFEIYSENKSGNNEKCSIS